MSSSPTGLRPGVVRRLANSNLVIDPAGRPRFNRGPLNPYDACLVEDRLRWEHIQCAGGLLNISCPRGRRVYPSPPWIVMPAEGKKFKPIGVLPVAGNFTGANIAVMAMNVDLGYDGVITDVVCEVTAVGATGFAEGSGDITWRLQANLRWMRDLGNIQVTTGSLTSPVAIPGTGLRIFSREVITFFVNMPAAAAARINPNANIICSINGWMYPR